MCASLCMHAWFMVIFRVSIYALYVSSLFYPSQMPTASFIITLLFTLSSTTTHTQTPTHVLLSSRSLSLSQFSLSFFLFFLHFFLSSSTHPITGSHNVGSATSSSSTLSFSRNSQSRNASDPKLEVSSPIVAAISKLCLRGTFRRFKSSSSARK